MPERISPRLRRLLDQKKIRRSKAPMEIVVRELDEATSDLETAKLTLKTASYKWAAIQACSSMFHAARSLLYRMGYREESRRGLLAALYQLYERDIVDKMLQDFSNAMTLEDQLHNGQGNSEDSAKTVLENATDFLEETARILAAPREWFERPVARLSVGKRKSAKKGRLGRRQ